MEIENYLEFLSEDDIRIKGTRVGIENILYEYIYKQRPPEEIIKHFYRPKTVSTVEETLFRVAKGLFMPIF